MLATPRRQAVTAAGAVVLAVTLWALGGHTSSALSTVLTNTVDVSQARIATCTLAVTRDSALWAFSLRDSTAVASNIVLPGAPGSYQNSGLLTANIVHQTGASGCTRDPAGYVSIDQFGNGNTGNAGWVNGPASGIPANSWTNGFTGEIWFRTTATGGGSLFALGNANFVANGLGTGITLSTKKDHQIFMTADGRLSFAMFKGSNLQVTSTKAYNDGVWHHAVATVSPTAGSALYVDNALIGTQPGATSGDIDTATSYLHLGYETLTGWTNAPAQWSWEGDLAYGAVYTTPLSAAAVKTHYLAGIP